MNRLHELPADLPQPEDDGACDHLVGMAMPHIRLASTTGESLPNGWDDIPGARGCTPEACAFRDHAAELGELGATVFGLSTQGTAYQREMAMRLHLPFEILSDADLVFANALRLPTFEVDGMRLIKRLTLVVRDGAIEHVFYPVFPPDAHASEVVAWLRRRV